MAASSLASSPSSVANDAAALTSFFAAMDQHARNTHAELKQFFERFGDAYGAARILRAATTPHLDVLAVFGLHRAELRHSDALAWFLRADGDHEQGSLFANAFLDLIGRQVLGNKLYFVYRERHARTDVALVAPDSCAIFIENKVDAREEEDQVDRMVRSMACASRGLGIPRENRYAIFLTECGSSPVTAPKSDDEDFVLTNLFPLKRTSVFEAFRTALSRSAAASPLLHGLLDAYLNSIRRLR